jgi:CrcB protein
VTGATGAATFLAVAAGGAAGSVARHAVGLWVGPHAAPGFPWATLAVNLGGSLVLGGVMAAVPADAPGHWRALLAVGFCGGFTTFSTFGAETVALLQARAYAVAAAYVAVSVAAGVAAVAAGLRLAARG